MDDPLTTTQPKYLQDHFAEKKNFFQLKLFCTAKKSDTKFLAWEFVRGFFVNVLVSPRCFIIRAVCLQTFRHAFVQKMMWANVG